MYITHIHSVGLHQPQTEIMINHLSSIISINATINKYNCKLWVNKYTYQILTQAQNISHVL